jgi:hypothetical protein
MKELILKAGDIIKIVGEDKKGSILVITNIDGDIVTKTNSRREMEE